MPVTDDLIKRLAWIAYNAYAHADGPQSTGHYIRKRMAEAIRRELQP